MRLTLEMLLGCLGLAGDQIDMESISTDDSKIITLRELLQLQMQVGELRMTCRKLNDRLKYGEDI